MPQATGRDGQQPSILQRQPSNNITASTNISDQLQSQDQQRKIDPHKQQQARQMGGHPPQTPEQNTSKDKIKSRKTQHSQNNNVPNGPKSPLAVKTNNDDIFKELEDYVQEKK